MNALIVIGLVLMFLGMAGGVIADIIYQSPIQKYLEKFGGKPAHLLTIGGSLDNYFSAKDLAKKWGHNLPFLRTYGWIVKLSLSLFFIGTIFGFIYLVSLI